MELSGVEALELLPVKQLTAINGEKILVDGDYDGEYFNEYRWTVLKGGYALRYGYSYDRIVNEKTGEHLGIKKGPIMFLHHQVLPPKKGFWVTHINGNKLDNRSCNLAYITPSDSAAKRPFGGNQKPAVSGYRGVKPIGHSYTNAKGQQVRWQSTNKWTATCQGKYLGSFNSKEEAARAYDREARRQWGDRAQVNFKEEN